ncbi:PF07603 family protein [Leptospira weilii serovar Ranarum str. ICFT]|uniref:PF07603 family protein n=1 Tax=Leptospira weilii serovar Ranarum str. ICFT TaxID=1218598 RepID=N1WA82_9LEPT|nr:PF07603 family protein [Leptospira weilii serovar Ranarum str. ICFT]
MVCNGTGHDGAFPDTPSARSFTGPTQHSQYLTDYTSLDNVKGLTWKSCAEGQSGPTCAIGAGAATNTDWNTATLGGPGTCSGLNAQNGGNGYAGRTDWRIPEVKELLSLFHSSNVPHLENVQFPNTDPANAYLTSTPPPFDGTSVWVVDFLSTGLPISSRPKAGGGGFLRCVSGNPPPAFSFQDNGNGTVTDRNTNLLWSKCALGKSNVNCTAGVLSFGNQQSAFNGCNGLNSAVPPFPFAGRNDWRLPNVNELLSIVDHSGAGNPAVPAVFSNFASGTFWTSTTDETNLNQGLVINFNGGSISSIAKTVGANGICVTNR